MRLRLARLPISPPVVVGAIATACWLLYAISTGDPWLARSAMHAGLFMVCVVATAAFGVVVAAEAVLALISGASASATGLQRVLLYTVLSFVGSFVTLSYFGVNLGAVLATSAIVTAAVGLALQPTLGSLISGLTLYSDGLLRVGDTAVMPDGEMVVTAMNWRTVVGQRSDGAAMVITNAKLSDNAFCVYRRGSPGRAGLAFTAPSSMSPQAVADLVCDMLADIDQVDPARAIDVMPTTLDAGGGLAGYRAEFWVRRHQDRAAAGALGLARLWYALQRHGLASVQLASSDSLAGLDRLAEAGGLDPRVAAALRQTAATLVFAPGERLTLPDRLAGSRLLLVRGSVRRASSFVADLADPSQTPADKSRRGAIEEVARELALLIGPYADYAVGRAAEQATDVLDLRGMVSAEIADPTARAAFLTGGGPRPDPAIEPGHLFDAHKDPSGRISCGPRLRAVDEVVLLAAPAEVFSPPRGRVARR